ncbi:T9SS C-terminal target domain-containing protein, partial [Taibaiella sp. KBW10]
YSLDGRLLLQKALSATQATIDISTLPIGIYTVKITDNNSTKTVKLIKE